MNGTVVITPLLNCSKYKDKIEKRSQLNFDDIVDLMRILLSKIHFIREEIIPPEIAVKAHRLCSDVDEKDTPFIALAIFLKIPLITRDKKLINALKEKGFEDIIPLDAVMK